VYDTRIFSLDVENLWLYFSVSYRGARCPICTTVHNEARLIYANLTQRITLATPPEQGSWANCFRTIFGAGKPAYMKRFLPVLILSVAVYFYSSSSDDSLSPTATVDQTRADSGYSTTTALVSGTQAQGSGIVVRVACSKVYSATGRAVVPAASPGIVIKRNSTQHRGLRVGDRP